MIPSVLIIDDDPDIRHNLAAYLEDDGMAVAAVDSYEAAAALLDEGGVYDICIMDARLPGLQGEAAIQLLKSRQPKLVFLLHTGTSEYSLPPELRSLGMNDDDVFIKPVGDMAWIANAIRNLITHSRTVKNGR